MEAVHGVRERAVASLPSSDAQRSSPFPLKGQILPPCKGMLRILQFVNGAKASNKWPVRQRVYTIAIVPTVTIVPCSSTGIG